MNGREVRSLQGIIAALLLALAAPAVAEVPAPPGGGFGLPVGCAMGAVCPVQNSIDHDPGPGWRDHSCGPPSYAGHSGLAITPEGRRVGQEWVSPVESRCAPGHF